jgi:hypothetical protein
MLLVESLEIFVDMLYKLLLAQHPEPAPKSIILWGWEVIGALCKPFPVCGESKLKPRTLYTISCMRLSLSRKLSPSEDRFSFQLLTMYSGPGEQVLPLRIHSFSSGSSICASTLIVHDEACRLELGKLLVVSVNWSENIWGELHELELEADGKREKLRSLGNNGALLLIGVD